MVSVKPDADVRQGMLAFFFLGVFFLLNISAKHEIIYSWVSVLSRKGE